MDGAVIRHGLSLALYSAPNINKSFSLQYAGLACLTVADPRDKWVWKNKPVVTRTKDQRTPQQDG